MRNDNSKLNMAIIRDIFNLKKLLSNMKSRKKNKIF